jgi:hypothetical protein
MHAAISCLPVGCINDLMYSLFFLKLRGISFRIKLKYSVLNPEASPYSWVCLLFLKEHLKQIISCLDLHCCEKMYQMQKIWGSQ